jgi:predicted enzyme related to lactoylglutathione lyase
MDKKFTSHGAPSWMELMTSDVNGAKDFYSAIFNWSFEKYPSEPEMEYYTISYEGEEYPFGGVFDKKEAMVDATEIPSHWGNYITVTNINETLLKVQNLGGKIIVPKTFIPNVGDFSVIMDPQGAVISLMQYSEEHNKN